AFVAIPDIAAAQGHELLKIDADFVAVFGEIVVHQAGIEEIDSGRHRGVSGEDVAGARHLQRFVEAQAMIAAQDANLFQNGKGGMAFVHVKNGGFETHRFQCPHAADTQNDLLPDARVDVAAVERVGDIAILGQHVLGDVRVHQVERNAAHFQLPNLNENVASG